MTTARPSFLLMTSFVLAAAGLFALAATPFLQTAAMVAL
jgi:hypothetical protein